MFTLNKNIEEPESFKEILSGNPWPVNQQKNSNKSKEILIIGTATVAGAFALAALSAQGSGRSLRDQPAFSLF